MRTRHIVIALALAGALPAALAQTPAEFDWRGKLEPAPGASLIRAALPADALLRLRSSQAADVRVFDAKGQPVPFAFAAPVDALAAARQPTPAFQALPMFTAQAGTRIPRSGIQVRVRDGAAQSVWVQMGAGTAGQAAVADGGARRLPSALFDVRSSRQLVSAIVLKAELPANAPIRFSLESSPDLAQWTPVALRGRIYRFEGQGAPVNDTLELEEPMKLEGRYLRLDWSGQEGVAVQSMSGLIASGPRAPAQVTTALPAGKAASVRDGIAGIEWELKSAAPLAALGLATTQSNTLLPVRVLGRSQPSEPWRAMGQGIVYRLGQGAAESSSLPLALDRAPVRWLRVEATHGQRLDAVPLTAVAVFDPVELVFVAGGNGPYELAAGRADTAAASLPLGMISAVVPGRIDDLPVSRIGAAVVRPEAPPSVLQQMLPAGTDSRSVMLWAILLVAVLVLGGVAWSLLKQLNQSKG